MAGACQDCDACCRVLEVKDHATGLDKAFGEPCKFLVKDLLGPGCGIYNVRPDACRGYVCLWLDAAVKQKEGKIFPSFEGQLLTSEELRPDVCGVMMGWPWGADRETLHVYPIPGHKKYPDAWRVPPVSDYLQAVIRKGAKLMVFVEGKRIAIRGDMAVVGTEEEFAKVLA